MPDTPLALVLSELKQLKKEGVESLYISEEALDQLHSPPSLAPKGPSKESSTLMKKSTSAASPSFLDNEILSIPSTKAIKMTDEHAVAPPSIQLPKASKEEQWAYLKNLVLSCKECKRHVKPGKHIVFGAGNIDADIFFCGEAPGADEETEGVPFVGRAGQLLTKMIQGMGLSREQVYIANIMNWRPEMDTPVGNRPPTQKEMEFCLPYLKAQVAIIKPKVIVALGATAVNGLLGANPKRKMGDIRGQWQSFEGTKLMITFHPSYLLRNNTNRTKRQVWEDLLAVMDALKLPISEKQKNYFL
jgi:uracil-DNA glycosylase